MRWTVNSHSEGERAHWLMTSTYSGHLITSSANGLASKSADPAPSSDEKKVQSEATRSTRPPLSTRPAGPNSPVQERIAVWLTQPDAPRF